MGRHPTRPLGWARDGAVRLEEGMSVFGGCQALVIAETVS